jgi:hypothetical protein
LKNIFFEKVNVLKRHDKDIQYTAKARNDMASLYKTTIPDLDEFQQLRPIHENSFRQKMRIQKRYSNKRKGYSNRATQRTIKEF